MRSLLLEMSDSEGSPIDMSVSPGCNQNPSAISEAQNSSLRDLADNVSGSSGHINRSIDGQSEQPSQSLANSLTVNVPSSPREPPHDDETEVTYVTVISGQVHSSSGSPPTDDGDDEYAFHSDDGHHVPVELRERDLEHTKPLPRYWRWWNSDLEGHDEQVGHTFSIHLDGHRILQPFPQRKSNNIHVHLNRVIHEISFSYMVWAYTGLRKTFLMYALYQLEEILKGLIAEQCDMPGDEDVVSLYISEFREKWVSLANNLETEYLDMYEQIQKLLVETEERAPDGQVNDRRWIIQALTGTLTMAADDYSARVHEKHREWEAEIINCQMLLAADGPSWSTALLETVISYQPQFVLTRIVHGDDCISVLPLPEHCELPFQCLDPNIEHEMAEKWEQADLL